MFYFSQAFSYLLLIFILFFFYFFIFLFSPLFLLWGVLPATNSHKLPTAFHTATTSRDCRLKGCKDSNQSGKNCGKPTEKPSVNLRRQRNVREKKRIKLSQGWRIVGRSLYLHYSLYFFSFSLRKKKIKRKSKNEREKRKKRKRREKEI